MSGDISAWLAKALLAENSSLKTFEVDVTDEESTIALLKALEASGCVVQRKLFSTRLEISCAPEQ